MSPEFTPFRIATFVVCIAVFWFLGGFTPLETELGGEFPIHRKTQKAWFYCILAFTGGAICVSFIEHKIGLMDPVNLRFAYIFFGIGLMVLGILWHQSLIEGLKARFQIQ